ncbi:hypothetical protein B0T20DRAFT_423956 [Sordaria brevicollis]|uniref:Glucose-methanol-choline oxidoreductase N-terminal domain-containing protein n=1 Tax=Sordaria brevicollis TaxID=83679 RepID=A0AAE0P1G7_SORBR|nr:hypothetical protein B0T20DRAFT_423956 [Sordaria brevicollis]
MYGKEQLGKSFGGLLVSLLVVCPSLIEANPVRVPRHATVVDSLSAAASNYTFVIAGGGIAGLTLADRLTEDPDVSVLVIDAGPLDQGEDGIMVPGSFSPWLYFWPNLFTTNEVGLNNRSVFTPIAQVVGGGSTINAMVFVRGKPDDYNKWGDVGNPGWSWKKLLPFFLKSENFTRPDPSFAKTANISWDDSVRGNGGPVQYTYPNYYYPGSANWWNAAQSAGLPAVKDPNGGDDLGIYWFPHAVDASTRTRSHSRRNHYDRVKDSRPNYHILPSNMVSKVIFRGTTAVGVEYLPTAGGKTSTAYAAKEVILAAGALNSPKILQLSGIGPKNLLQKHMIPIVVDLPGVGANLQDQLTLKVGYTASRNLFPNSGSIANNATYAAEQRALYDSKKEGAYTIVSTLSTNIAMLNLKQTTSSYKQIISKGRAAVAPYSLSSDVDATVLAGYAAQRRLILEQYESGKAGIGSLHWNTADGVTIYLNKPLSRGAVTINSINPLENPLVNYRTVTDPVDVEVLTALFRKNRELMSAPDMASLGVAEAAPFGEQITSDSELASVFREVIDPSNAHQCCTAAMMPRALGGVVSSEQKVYGVKDLRVADISYWPFQVSAAPTATMYASGEQLADAIKKEHKLAEYKRQ